LTAHSRLTLSPMMPQPITDENPESDTKSVALTDQDGRANARTSRHRLRACDRPPRLSPTPG
jgi:hypothetical protein